MANKLEQYLTRYLSNMKVPKIKVNEAEILAEEIAKIVEVLKEKPDIGYNELWDEIHED